MKVFNKLILTSSILMLSGCSFAFKSSSLSSSSLENYSSILETPSSNISNSLAILEGEGVISLKEFDNNSKLTSVYVLQNIDCTLNTEGDVLPLVSYNGFSIGSNNNQGKIIVNFNNYIVVDRISFKTFAFQDLGSNMSIKINDIEYDAAILKEDLAYVKMFNEPTLIKKLEISCDGLNNRCIFKGIKFNYSNPIRVNSIELNQDVINCSINQEVEIQSSYSILPENATVKDVIVSSNDEYVTIIDNSKVSCSMPGIHNVTITTIDGGYSVTISLNVSGTSLDGYRRLSEENIRFTYSSLFENLDCYGIPSKGNPNILVVPVEFSDLKSTYSFTKANLQTLDAAFNGNKENHENDYADSLRSFYKKSSYNKLDMNFVITDPLIPSITSSTFVSLESSSSSQAQGSYNIVEELYQKGTINNQKINFHDSKYDYNSDGYVDGVWFIYNDDRYETVENFWAYTFWYYSAENTNINISCFANMSAFFLYEGTKTGQDYHTLVHETGHMLGLDDYYMTDSNATSAIGGLDMMDYNIGEHNAFSKFALGWVEPYVVTDSTTIILKPFESSGDCIIIPTSTFNDSAFSEFIILEYYTPTGLNYLDSHVAYSTRPKYFTKSGVRMFHIDARLMELKYNYSTGYEPTGNYLPSDATSIPYTYNSYYQVSGANSKSYRLSNYDLIQAITKDNRLTTNGSITNNNSLFVQGNKFDPSTYTKFFTNSKMHNGESFDYTIEIVSLTSDNCTIKIEKK